MENNPQRFNGEGAVYEKGEKVADVRYDLYAASRDEHGPNTIWTGTISSGRTVVDFRSFFMSDDLTLELEDGRRLPFVFEDPRAGTIRASVNQERESST